jgi:hypothetical protein
MDLVGPNRFEILARGKDANIRTLGVTIDIYISKHKYKII